MNNNGWWSNVNIPSKEIVRRAYSDRVYPLHKRTPVQHTILVLLHLNEVDAEDKYKLLACLKQFSWMPSLLLSQFHFKIFFDRTNQSRSRLKNRLYSYLTLKLRFFSFFSLTLRSRSSSMGWLHLHNSKNKRPIRKYNANDVSGNEEATSSEGTSY